MTAAASETDPQSFSMSFDGTLVPGGLVRVTGKMVVRGTEGTPGCVRGRPTRTCPTGEPQGAPLLVGITHIDQAGDPDSFGPGCDAAAQVRQCPTGIHDKRVEPDEVDSSGYNMDAGLGVSASYNLTSRLDLLSPPPAGGWSAGAPVTYRLSAFNAGPAPALSGWTLTLLLPQGSAPVVPNGNALRYCAQGVSAVGYPFVRCTGRGPLSPGVTSIAVDVTAMIAASTTPGSQVPAAAYVQPAAAQGAEMNPLGAPPNSPLVDAATSATDNDASAVLEVQ